MSERIFFNGPVEFNTRGYRGYQIGRVLKYCFEPLMHHHVEEKRGVVLGEADRDFDKGDAEIVLSRLYTPLSSHKYPGEKYLNEDDRIQREMGAVAA